MKKLFDIFYKTKTQMPVYIKGSQGGAWDEKTHLQLYPDSFDKGLAEFIVSKLNPVSVLEFGSGLGFLSDYIKREIPIENVLCIEPNDMGEIYNKIGSPVLINIDIFKDQHPAILNQKFDMVLCIEVAEHIDICNHQLLFDFLVEHSSNQIVFSGATPGQGGHGHIAERTEEEWKDEFIKRGLLYEETLTINIRNSCSLRNINHRKNIMVFTRPEEYCKLDIIEKKAYSHLINILSIVKVSGSLLEGNLFYENLRDANNIMPRDCLKEKRLNVAKLVKGKKNILNIGFNAGHSTLLMLLANENCYIDICDIFAHNYTEKCFDYLDSLFPGRLKMYKGNSLDVLDKISVKRYDLIHIDAGKDKTIESDLLKTSMMVENEHVIIVDDTQNEKLKNVLDNWIYKKKFLIERYKNFNDKVNSYKWKHTIGCFSSTGCFQIDRKEFIFEQLKKIYSTFDYPSIYTDSDSLKKISGSLRANSLMDIIFEIVSNNINGDFVECGVAAAHSSVIAAFAFQELHDLKRNLYLYDTFQGFTDVDCSEQDYRNKSIGDYDLSKYQLKYCSKQYVLETMIKTGYPEHKIKLIQGLVEDTIKNTKPDAISILRIDVDLYKPTRTVLNYLFKNVSKGGYIIFDDYGHWKGAKKAVDEFLITNGISPSELVNIDYTCKILQK